MLRVAPGPRTEDDPFGRNRLECRTCTYQRPIEEGQGVKDTKIIKKKKEVEDVMGGAGAWDNVDKTDGRLIRSRSSNLLTVLQCSVPTTNATVPKPSSSRCKREVPTSL